LIWCQATAPSLAEGLEQDLVAIAKPNTLTREQDYTVKDTLYKPSEASENGYEVVAS
jgi:hypothetical protein